MIARRALPRLQQPFRQYSGHQCLAYSTVELNNGVKLAYDLHEPTKGVRENAPPIIFLHGLFGSKKNNRSISKYAPYSPVPPLKDRFSQIGRVLARDLKRPVYALDLRNHGDSSHHQRHDYTALAEDLELFVKQLRLENPTLIGHSMGAKTVMTVALRNRVPIANLIPVDNAPVDAALHSAFAKYEQGMRKIDETTIRRQSEADAILQDYEESLPIRQFLLGNLIRRPDGTQTWQIPIKILTNALDNMADFPFTDPDEVRYVGPSLMV